MLGKKRLVGFYKFNEGREFLAEILLHCSHLRGLKRLPGIPSAFKEETAGDTPAATTFRLTQPPLQLPRSCIVSGL
jgi:hypothetical protein